MSNKLFLGIDEAGRGPVLGPLVVAGAAFTDVGIEILKGFSVRDSKTLSAKKRQYFANIICEEAAWYNVFVAWPEMVDDYVVKNGLNKLECELMSSIMEASCSSTVVHVDSPQTPEKFEMMLKAMLSQQA